jgi:topoisomerase-4 subunit A
LEINLKDLQEQWHFSSLEKIFIEKRIYRDIEEEDTWEGVIKAIDKGLSKYKKIFFRAITEEDIVRLTEIRIKRISKFDAFKADEHINKLESGIAEVENNLKNLTKYAVKYFETLLKKYGAGRERKTEIKLFDTIEVKMVAVMNKKLYVNRVEGFVGMGLKSDELVCACSDIDDIIVFMKSGKMIVSKVGEKKFFGKDILHVDVWKKEEDRKIYHMIYTDGKTKRTFVKRFAVTAITRDKEYDLTSGEAGSKVLYFSAQPNSESEIVNIQLHPAAAAKNKVFDFNFGELAVKGRQSQGNIITKYPVKKVEFKSKGQSTLGGVDIWLDETVGRLNKEQRGRHLGVFDTGNHLLVLYKNGDYELTNFELTNRYDLDAIQEIVKYHPGYVISTVYYDGASKNIYIKRFKIEASVESKRYRFITEHNASKVMVLTLKKNSQIQFTILKGKTKDKETETHFIKDLIEVKGWKALGNKLTYFPIDGDIKELVNEEESEEETYAPSGKILGPDFDGGVEDAGEQGELFE